MKRVNSWEEVEDLSWIKNETVIKNVNIYDFSSFHSNSFVHFSDKIIKTGSMDEFEEYIELFDNLKVMDGENQLVMPTLIAGHTHIYSTFARGMSVPFNPKSFTDILTQLWWKLDNELDEETVFLSGLVSGLDFIKNGVTTVFDHHASGKSISGVLDVLSRSVCDEVGMRGGFCFETSDRFNVDACIDENNRFIEASKLKSDRFGLFGLHASMTLSDETLNKVKSVIGEEPIHIHVAESIEDQEHSLKKYGKSVIERLDGFGLLNKNSILVHCIHITPEDALIIKEAECFVALNVTSNMNNSVGLPNIKLLRDAGIKCIIGNDGMTSDITSEWRNLLFALHHQTKSPTGFTLDDLREMILNSYEYANRLMSCKIGELAGGYEADLMMLAYNPPTPMNEDNALGHVIFGLSHSFKPQYVWCKGTLLIENYELNEHRYKDVLPKLDHVQESVKRLWDRINNNSNLV